MNASTESDQLRCKGTSGDGTPCSAPPAWINPSSGYCRNHDPALAEERKEIARKAGERSGDVRRRKAADGLHPDELGALTTIEDQMRWLRVVAQAIAERRLTHQEGAVISRLLSEWVKSEDVRLRAVDLRKLQRQVEQIRTRGKK